VRSDEYQKGSFPSPLIRSTEELSMSAILRPLTYHDLLEMPDDGQRYESIDGELIVTPAPAMKHQRVLRSLIRVLGSFAYETGRGELVMPPFDVVLGPYNIVKPDLLLIASDSGHLPGDHDTFEGPPDLVVEVSSPISLRIELVRKSALYARCGVPEYWIADPERRRMVINILQDKEYIPAEPDADGWLTSGVFPELRVNPAAVFSGLD
jgi:Uma2 family endonuclease